MNLKVLKECSYDYYFNLGKDKDLEEKNKRNPRWVPSDEIVEKLTNFYLSKDGIIVFFFYFIIKFLYSSK
jgi:hypothetical protein